MACYRQDSENEDTCLDMERLVQRFRANLVISGQEPFVEESWSHLTIGASQFKVKTSTYTDTLINSKKIKNAHYIMFFLLCLGNRKMWPLPDDWS